MRVWPSPWTIWATWDPWTKGNILWRLLRPGICREAGGRVRSNVFLREVDLGVGGVLDNKRLEVVVNGRPSVQRRSVGGGHYTLVSPIRRDGTSRIYGVKTIDWENLSRSICL